MEAGRNAGNQFASIVTFGFIEHAFDVILNRRRRDRERICDVIERTAVEEERQYLGFTGRDPVAERDAGQRVRRWLRDRREPR